MSKRAGKSGAVLLLSGIVGLMTSCGPAPAPTVNVKPIPTTVPPSIAQTPLPGSSLLPIPSLPGQTPTPGSSGTPGTPIATPTPIPGPGQLAISSSTLPTAALNFTYNAALTAVGGSGSYRWNLASGTLPNGLILDQATGQIFGKPTQTGTFSFEVQAIDTAANAARRSMFILVSDTNSGVNSVGVLTTSLVSGTVDRRYSQTLNVGGGVAPYSWSISSGALPDGLEINPTTGEISGTPKLQGEETFTIKVIDARGQAATKTLSITINRTDSNIAILTDTLPIGILNKAYVRTGCGTAFSGQLAATGGNNTYTWQVSSGTLPTGLTLASNGALTGTPTATGASTFTVQVSDTDNNRTSKVFTVEIRDILVHRFSPNAGGEGLRIVVEGENFGSNADNYNVEFGGVNQATIAAKDTTTDPNCHKLTLAIPAGAKTGMLLVKNTTTGKNGSSTIPFLATDVVINEVFTNPDSSGNQFVELLNKGTSSASIAGWHLRYTDKNGTLADFTIPAETPPLAPDAVTVININKAGGSSATNLYTGTGLAEMRFDPTNATASSALTQIALCTDSACTVTATDTNYRDYLQFGPNAATDGGALENNAVTSGIWTDNATLDVTTLKGVLDTANINNTNAHNGTNDGTTNQGLLLSAADAAKFAVNDVIVFDNAATGGKITRQKRTVPAKNGNRVTLDSALFTSTIQSTNTGNGTTGNGILVDKTTDTFSSMSVSDFVNVLAGGTIRTVSALPAGPKIELDNTINTFVDANNTSDGLLANGGLLVKAGTSATFPASSVVTITVGQGTTAFTVNRNVVSLPDANHVVIDQALATAPVSAANTGDGTFGNGIDVTSATNFLTGRKVFINGQTRVVSINSTQSTNKFELKDTLGNYQPIASMSIATNNTGTGASGSEISVAATTGFSIGSKVRINGQIRTIAGMIPGPKLQLDQPLSMVISNALGDGSTGNGVTVSSTQGFASTNNILIAGQTKTITVVGSTLEFAPISFTPNTDVDGTSSAQIVLDATVGGIAKVGDGLRIPGKNVVRNIATKAGNNVTLNAPFVTTTSGAAVTVATNTLTVASTTNFAAGDKIRFAGGGNGGAIATIQSVTPTSITFTGNVNNIALGETLNLDVNGVALNYVPISGTIVMQGNASNTDFVDTLHLVPTSGSFTLVPFDTTASTPSTQSTNNDDTDGVLSRVPTSGTILVAPKSGTISKYFSIKYDGSGNATTDFTATSAPTGGTK